MQYKALNNEGILKENGNVEFSDKEFALRRST